ncbi:hypothetical protein HMPREF0972_01887 [Actinomyces sp. oral taxon 848 str. F0332]|nr:hypothetical protein HMPREF0972_01887 [Actinomyces sp. oral taxon 848 str. F0332]
MHVPNSARGFGEPIGGRAGDASRRGARSSYPVQRAHIRFL